MIRKILIAALFFISFYNFAFAYDYVKISNPSFTKTPIAIPASKNMSDNNSGQEIIFETERILKYYINFIGLFDILDPKFFIDNVQETGIISSKINFKNWSSIGAELLLTTGIKVYENKVLLELRLFDTFKGQLIVGKIYRINVADIRQSLKNFCDSVMKSLTGQDSIYNSKIAFVVKEGNNKEIFISDFDGNNTIRQTNKKNICLNPAWASDGKKLGFVSFVRGRQELFIKDLKKTDSYILNFNGVTIGPEWLPKSPNKIAITLSIAGDQEIYLINNKGEILKRLTKQYGIDISPTFSKDEKKMAFVSNKSGKPQVYVMDLETEEVKRLTFTGRYNTSPAWSPTEDKIAFVSLHDNNIDIFTINPDGSNLLQLTSNSGYNESPSWSPDGNLIVFSSTREGKAKLYVMTSLGSEQRKLDIDAEEQTEPAWSPAHIENID